MAAVKPDYTSCCQWARCRQANIAIIWGGIGLCGPHWQKVAGIPGLVIKNLAPHVSRRVMRELQRNLGLPEPRSCRGMFGL